MKKYVSLVLGAVIFLSVALYAQPGKGGMGMGPRMGRQQLKELLKLTPDQEKQIHELRYQQQKDAIDIRAQIQKNRLELRKMISENNINESKIFQLTDENSKLQGDLKHSAIKHFLDVYKLLDDNQKTIFAKHFEKFSGEKFMRGRMMQHMQNRPMGGRGMGSGKGPNN
ncbi:MAG: Spy/CpxP family protein refolding chaperone [Bacteroidetes bacterium]|nr:Spy/CpxP family protein refolding chaperone [Bacteroidota bacterium]